MKDSSRSTTVQSGPLHERFTEEVAFPAAEEPLTVERLTTIGERYGEERERVVPLLVSGRHRSLRQEQEIQTK